MMDRTDRHFRYLARLISRRSLLYTEMVHVQALLRGRSRERLLAYDPVEHPLALQLGGSDPEALGRCARMAEEYGFDEVNLNCGCPSDRVQQGCFGACLMAKPQQVAHCVAAMTRASSRPVTIKTRLGIDERDSYEELRRFVEIVCDAGCRTVILHARKAWLKGLSPKENREVPPLRYGVVHALKRDLPQIEIIINGGFTTLAQVEEQLRRVDGVMIGREAYQNPYLLAEVDRQFFGATLPPPTRIEVLGRYQEYIEREVSDGTPRHRMNRHLAGLFHGQPGGRSWRRELVMGTPYNFPSPQEVCGTSALRGEGIS